VIRVALLLGCLVALLAAATAGAQRAADVEAIYDDFRADGVISPCRHTTDALERAEDSITDPVEEISPDLPGAIRAAIEARERGECDDEDEDAEPTATATATATVTATATAAPSATASPTASATPFSEPSPSATPSVEPDATATETPSAQPGGVAPVTTPTPTPSPVPGVSEGGDGVPGAVWALGALGALAALGGTLALVIAARGRRGPMAHAWREAGWRAEGAWADFRDWVRVGR
jgi:hypothetical protein